MSELIFRDNITIATLAGISGNLLTVNPDGRIIDSGVSQGDLDGDFVNTTGDTMTGELVLQGGVTSPGISGTNVEEFGSNVLASGTDTIIVGKDVITSGESNVIIGTGLTLNDSNSIVLVGIGAECTGTTSVCIGSLAKVTSTFGSGVAIGHGAIAEGNGSTIAIGKAAVAGGTGGVSIGNNSQALNSSLSIGLSTSALKGTSIVIGANSVSNFADTSIFATRGVTTQINQTVIGSLDTPQTDVAFGHGPTAPDTSPVTIRSTDGGGRIAIGSYTSNGAVVTVVSSGHDLEVGDVISIVYRSTTNISLGDKTVASVISSNSFTIDYVGTPTTQTEYLQYNNQTTVVDGAHNRSGSDLIIQGGKSTGVGKGGDVVIKASPKVSGISGLNVIASEDYATASSEHDSFIVHKEFLAEKSIDVTETLTVDQETLLKSTLELGEVEVGLSGQYTPTPQVSGNGMVWTQTTDSLFHFMKDQKKYELGHDIWTVVPDSQYSSGIKGQRAYDGTYMYECVEINVWVRWAVETSF